LGPGKLPNRLGFFAAAGGAAVAVLVAAGAASTAALPLRIRFWTLYSLSDSDPLPYPVSRSIRSGLLKHSKRFTQAADMAMQACMLETGRSFYPLVCLGKCGALSCVDRLGSTVLNLLVLSTEQGCFSIPN
jgi:hypothetical protein